MSFVGIIANPASGKDIRRLVAYGSVFDNQEKVRIVRRIILGLLATGVKQICYLPDYFGIVPRALESLRVNIPVFPANFKPSATQEDSVKAGRLMAERGVDCIVTLGGDGTNRAVVKGTRTVPILPISTGTNNVFPAMVEGTLAGLAAGLVAGKLVPLDQASYHSTLLEVHKNGQPVDIALVDIIVYQDWFIGSRAVWDMSKVARMFLNRSDPASIGLSSVGGLLQRIRPEEPAGLCLTLGNGARRVLAPVAPGVLTDIGLKSVDMMDLEQDFTVDSRPAVLALDGERELELLPDQEYSIRLVQNGPVVVDVARAMNAAMEGRVFTTENAEIVETAMAIDG